MTIQQCIYVRKIAKAGSFREAAEQLFIAQSSLSASVKALERELGIEIFERSSNGVILTDDGAEFIKYADGIAEYSRFVEERYRSDTEIKSLHIATQHYDFIADVFGRMVAETECDKYSFSLKELRTCEIIHEVEISRCEIGIIAVKENDRGVMRRYLDKKGISFNSLFKTLPHVFLREGHPLLCCERISCDSLHEYPYVSYEQGERNIPFFMEELTDDTDVDKNITISDRATLMNVLLLTDCYTIGTGLMPSALNEGKIKSVPLESDENYSIGYIVRADKKLSSLAEEFLQRLKDSAEEFSEN